MGKKAESPFEDFTDEPEEEEDEYEAIEGEVDFGCDRLDEGQTCDNGGKCVVFNAGLSEMVICPHFYVEDDEPGMVNN